MLHVLPGRLARRPLRCARSWDLNEGHRGHQRTTLDVSQRREVAVRDGSSSTCSTANLNFWQQPASLRLPSAQPAPSSFAPFWDKVLSVVLISRFKALAPCSIAARIQELRRNTCRVHQTQCKGGLPWSSQATHRTGRPDYPLFKGLGLRCCWFARRHWAWGFQEGLNGYCFFFFDLFMPTPRGVRGMVDAVSTFPVSLRTRGEGGLS